MNEDEKAAEVNEITQLLIRLRPARAEIDSRVLFYEAGFNARQSQLASPRRPRLAPLIAAGLVIAVVSASASYRIGQTTAIQAASQENLKDATSVAIPNASSTHEQQPRLESHVEDDHPIQIEEPRRWTDSRMFAQWLEPLGALSEFGEYKGDSETTLAVFHSSRVSRDAPNRDWIDSPFSTTLARYRDWGTAASDGNPEPTSPLAASDSQAFAQSLETTR